MASVMSCIVQARPETVHSRKQGATLKTYTLHEKGDAVVSGLAIGQAVAAGIVTDHGGRTSHAAIVSREPGIPAVVGTGNATESLEDRRFALECRANRRVRNETGFRNVVVTIRFCRTPDEADRVLEVLAEEGLERGRDGLEIHVIAAIPSNILEADAAVNPDSVLDVIEHVAAAEARRRGG
jgi:phosphoenolpyruvate synthase/pyruvate phosphate dikinase